MSKTSFEISKIFAETLYNDANIKTFCQSNFSKDQVVILGGNPKNPPSQAQMPAIIVAGVIESDIQQTRASHKYGIFSYLEKEGETPINGVIHLDGYKLQEEFRSLIDNSLKQIKSLGLITIKSQSELAGSFPVFVGFSIVTISKPTSSRGN